MLGTDAACHYRQSRSGRGPAPTMDAKSAIVRVIWDLGIDRRDLPSFCRVTEMSSLGPFRRSGIYREVRLVTTR